MKEMLTKSTLFWLSICSVYYINTLLGVALRQITKSAGAHDRERLHVYAAFPVSYHCLLHQKWVFWWHFLTVKHAFNVYLYSAKSTNVVLSLKSLRFHKTFPISAPTSNPLYIFLSHFMCCAWYAWRFYFRFILICYCLKFDFKQNIKGDRKPWKDAFFLSMHNWNYFSYCWDILTKWTRTFQHIFRNLSPDMKSIWVSRLSNDVELNGTTVHFLRVLWGKQCHLSQ